MMISSSIDPTLLSFKCSCWRSGRNRKLFATSRRRRSNLSKFFNISSSDSSPAMSSVSDPEVCPDSKLALLEADNLPLESNSPMGDDEDDPEEEEGELELGFGLEIGDRREDD